MGWSTPNTAETQIHPDFETHTHPEPKEAIARPLIGAGGVCPRLNPTHCIRSAIEAWWAHNPQGKGPSPIGPIMRPAMPLLYNLAEPYS